MPIRRYSAAIVLACLACASGDQTAPSDPDFVSANAVASLTLTPSPASVIAPGGTLQLTAELRDAAGKLLPPSAAPVAWRSLAPAKATVSASGLVRAVAASGQARIMATAQGKADTVLVTLTARPSTSLSQLAAPATKVALAAPISVTVTAKDSLNRPVPGVAVVLTATGSGNLVPSGVVTDANGQATMTFSSTVAEPKTLAATVAGVAIKKTVALTVTPDAVIPVAQCALPKIPPASTVNVASNIPYGSAPAASQRLDIAWPKTAGPHPLVLVIHGGGWSGGDKSDFASEIRILAGLGYTAVAVNYRLVTGKNNIFPAAVEDLRCALRWLRSKASTYGYDPDHIAVFGSSAGGHLAEMLGLASTAAKLDGKTCQNPGPMAAIQAVISLSGPSDLRKSSLFTSQSLPTVSALLGGSPESQPARAALASPITHVQSVEPKTLLIHGTSDPVVPMVHATSLQTRLRQARIPVTLSALNLGHGFKLFASGSGTLSAACTAVAFLRQEL